MRTCAARKPRSCTPCASGTCALLTLWCSLQARNEVHRLAALLGAALVSRLAGLSAALCKAEARQRAQRERRALQPQPGHPARLAGLLHWGRRRPGEHHEGGGLLCAPPLWHVAARRSLLRSAWTGSPPGTLAAVTEVQA